MGVPKKGPEVGKLKSVWYIQRMSQNQFDWSKEFILENREEKVAAESI